MYWRKVPWIIQRLVPHVIWRIPNSENKIYLTFDDGPCPNVTNKILEILHEKEVKASFFCLGKNVENHPNIFEALKENGHFVGNHGWSHLDGWVITRDTFLQNISKAKKFYDNDFFRPPYGKINWRLLFSSPKDCQFVLWDILSGDFDPNIDRNSCLNFVLKNVKPGSIIVFHDNDKSSEKMLSILPELIDELKMKSFVFDRL